MERDYEEKILGTFEVTGNRLRVSDPCYTRDTWCAGVINNVQPGTWKASVVMSDEGQWGKRVSELHVWHSDHLQQMHNAYEPLTIDVGVDSGQCGFYDDNKYPVDKSEHEYSDGSWYERACACTIEMNTEKHTEWKSGILEDMGVVASSGYGDGSYTAYVFKNHIGEVVAAKVVFIGDYDEEDEDYDDYDEDYEDDEWDNDDED